MHDCCNSIVSALELLQSCTKPSMLVPKITSQWHRWETKIGISTHLHPHPLHPFIEIMWEGRIKSLHSKGLSLIIGIYIHIYDNGTHVPDLLIVPDFKWIYVMLCYLEWQSSTLHRNDQKYLINQYYIFDNCWYRSDCNMDIWCIKNIYLNGFYQNDAAPKVL